MAKPAHSTATPQCLFATSGDDARIVPFPSPKPERPGHIDGGKFEALDAEFTWTDMEWSRAHLTSVRIAVLLLRMNWRTCDFATSKMLSGDPAASIDTILDHLRQTHSHLRVLVRVIEAAQARIALSLERSAPDHPCAAPSLNALEEV